MGLQLQLEPTVFTAENHWTTIDRSKTLSCQRSTNYVTALLNPLVLIGNYSCHWLWMIISDSWLANFTNSLCYMINYVLKRYINLFPIWNNFFQIFRKLFKLAGKALGASHGTTSSKTWVFHVKQNLFDLFCLRPSGSETYKLACDWPTPSLTLSGRFVETQTVTHVSLMLGLWNFNRTSLTTRQLMSNDLTNLFQLLTAVISC